MLAEAASVKRLSSPVGEWNRLKEIDGLALLIETRHGLDPFEKNILFLFCGSHSDRIRGLLWAGNGFLLLYKRLKNEPFS